MEKPGGCHFDGKADSVVYFSAAGRESMIGEGAFVSLRLMSEAVASMCGVGEGHLSGWVEAVVGGVSHLASASLAEAGAVSWKRQAAARSLTCVWCFFTYVWMVGAGPRFLRGRVAC